MIQETRHYIRSNTNGTSTLKLLDERVANVLSVGFVPDLKIMKKIWESGSGLQANEYRLLMQVLFCIVAVTLMMHVFFFYRLLQLY